jgi:hypothetical protein
MVMQSPGVGRTKEIIRLPPTGAEIPVDLRHLVPGSGSSYGEGHTEAEQIRLLVEYHRVAPLNEDLPSTEQESDVARRNSQGCAAAQQT